MRCPYGCHSPEHMLARRRFLGQLAAGSGILVGGLDALVRPAAAAQLAKNQRRVLCFFLSGGVSQFESWDPKPGTDTGGPFRAIPTAVPGVHISELLPNVARQMQHLMIVRGMNTQEDEHGRAAYMMSTGRRKTPAADYPILGAVMAKALAPEDSVLPGHIRISPRSGGGERGNDSAYLGPRYASLMLGNGNPPANSARDASLASAADEERNVLRRRADERFLSRCRTAQTDAYTYSYEQARRLMGVRDLFDVTKEPAADLDRYGTYALGRHCLLARRLLSGGATYVHVQHTNYDTHNENFDFHLEQLGEFDRSFAALVADLADRGMLDSTLIIVLAEFGRSPKINHSYGRDHWSAAWSVLLGGCGIQRGGVFGKTNANGTEVIEHQVDHAQLFHTYLRAVGLDSTDTFDVGGRPMPMADPAAAAIKELLA
jgi:uncharacterized protein (DUF1501 family)